MGMLVPYVLMPARVLILLFLTISWPATAQLQAELEPVVARPRGGSPIAVRVTLRGAASQRRGRLELLVDRSTVVVSDALVVPPAGLTTRMVLPSSELRTLAIEVHWRDEGGERVPLGRRELQLAWSPGAIAALVVTSQSQAGRQEALGLADALRRCADPMRDPLHPPLIASPIERLPRAFELLLAVDCVVLGGEAFAELDEEQLALLRRWIERGGSALVCPTRALQPRHVAWLEAALPRGWTLAEGGALEQLPELARRPALGALELGRLAVVAGLAADRATLVLREELLRLYDEGATVPDRLRLRLPAPEALRQLSRLRLEDADRSAISGELAPELERYLTPPEVEPPSFGIVAAIYALLLLVVGPLDRWLLRGRWRLSWLLLIAGVGAASWAIIALAERNLGAATRSRQVVVEDIGFDGQLLRRTRWHYLMPRRSEPLSLELEGLLGEPRPTRLEGRYPARYRATITARRWAPQVIETRGWSGAPSELGIDWSRVRLNRPGGLEALEAASPGLVCVVRAGRRGRRTELSPRSANLAPEVRRLCYAFGKLSAGLATAPGADADAGALRLLGPGERLVLLAVEREDGLLIQRRRIR